VQTSTPDHPAIMAATRHDYEAFVRSELPMREALLYPPFGHIVRFVVRSRDEQAAANWAAHITGRLRHEAQALGAASGAAGPAIRVLGPAPAPIARLRDRFRYHVQAMGRDEAVLRDLVKRATATLQTPDTVAWIVDVDPVEML
jgi:primosomal protein N' (replication factor Y)